MEEILRRRATPHGVLKPQIQHVHNINQNYTEHFVQVIFTV